jgi:predicted  nucleic acid-binding Zn-ribbon protein
MQLWNLNIIFIEKFTVRQFQEINRLNEKYTNWEIDTTALSNELFKLVIDNINWEKDKEKIENLILDMDSLEDYSKLNEEVAKIINEATNWLKKKS